MDTPTSFVIELKEILLNKDFSKFGDSIVNFIYNAAVFEIMNQSRGTKVWDSCLAHACRNSKLREFLGTRKNVGDIGDAVEAFIAFMYLKNKKIINEMILVLSRNIDKNKNFFQVKEKEICTESFTLLIDNLCEKLGIN